MAKVKGMAATNYVGKLGPQIFYMRDGQNVVREKAAQVSNPQTNAQMNQRIKFANLIALYRLNKEWMEKYAFPLRPATQSVYNAFMSANLGRSQVALTKEENQAGIVVLEPVDFTKGNLRQISLQYDGDVAFKSDILLGLPITNFPTIDSISKAIIDRNSWLRDGDQLSIIFNTTDVNNYGKVFAAEFTLTLGDETLIGESAAAEFFQVAGSDSGNHLQFNMDAMPDQVYTGAEVVGAVLVVSRISSTETRVSSSRMTLSTEDVLNTFNTEAARRAARRSYGGEETAPFLVPGYPGEGTPSLRVTSINGMAPSEDNTLLVGQDADIEVVFNSSEALADAAIEMLFIEYTYFDGSDNEDGNYHASSGWTISGRKLTIAAEDMEWPADAQGDITITKFWLEDENGNAFATAEYHGHS